MSPVKDRSETIDGSPPKRLRIISRAALKRLGILAILVVAAGSWVYWSMLRMPGRSCEGSFPPLTPEQQALARELRTTVERLATGIGARNVFLPENLHRAADELQASLESSGYEVERQEFEVLNVTCANLIAERTGNAMADEVIVIGAHYDSCADTPGADDNASGCAGLLAIASRFVSTQPQRTVRFVFFVNEEPPFFQTDDMGSLRYARRCRARGERIVAMISLEMLGCFRDQPGSQRYPIAALGLVYPDQGNFIGFAGNYRSRALVRESIGVFRESAQFPSEGAALPGWIEGVGWSDHWAFWQAGYPAVMVTDTALFRSTDYHQLSDTADRLDYERMARVVDGMLTVVDRLASPSGD